MALVDRGANGGLMGSEGRLVQWTDRTIDCTGIDSHEIRDLKIGHFGATVKTQSGPIIIEMHEYAYVQGGKTIHSSGQIEHNKNTVNDKAAAITGETPHIRTLEGYMIPMKVINGLTYIKMRPYTDQEWKTLPHVNLTGVGEWDPSVLGGSSSSDSSSSGLTQPVSVNGISWVYSDVRGCFAYQSDGIPASSTDGSHSPTPVRFTCGSVFHSWSV